MSWMKNKPEAFRPLCLSSRGFKLTGSASSQMNNARYLLGQVVHHDYPRNVEPSDLRT